MTAARHTLVLEPVATPTTRSVQYAMGMPIRGALRGRHTDDDAAQAAWTKVMNQLHQADEDFSTYRADSYISRLDRAEIALSDCPPEVADVLAPGEVARRESAGAILRPAQQHNVALQAATDFTSVPGRGVTARVDGYAVAVGSPALLGELPHTTALTEATALVATAEAAGQTGAVVVVDGTPTAVLALADQTRPAAKETVAALTTCTGHRPTLLTGDNAGAAGRLAEEVDITDVRANLLPADKVANVHNLQATGHRVMLIGDGVNDAPATASATLGVAMGQSGSDLALQTADAVIVRNDLTTLPAMLTLAVHAQRVIKANLAIAATVITGLVVWDLIGNLPLPLGVAGHEGSTVIVGLNGLRLLRNKAWR